MSAATNAQNAEQPSAEHAQLATASAREPATLAGSSLGHQEHVLIVLAGDQRTYENRVQLRSWGLRWVREEHRWVGILPKTRAWYLTAQLGLQVVGRPVAVEPAPAEGDRDPVPPGAPSPRGPAPPAGPEGPVEGPAPTCPAPSSPSVLLPPVALAGAPSAPSPHRRRDYRRSSSESHLLFREPSVGGEDGWDVRGFSLPDITSGLPDDDRSSDDRRAASRLRDLRGRVKAARAALSAVPGAEETLRADWKREAHFLARWGITQEQFRHGVPELPESEAEPLPSYADGLAEVRAREAARLPGSEV